MHYYSENHEWGKHNELQHKLNPVRHRKNNRKTQTSKEQLDEIMKHVHEQEVKLQKERSPPFYSNDTSLVELLWKYQADLHLCKILQDPSIPDISKLQLIREPIVYAGNLWAGIDGENAW
jgi:hypothetical protein